MRNTSNCFHDGRPTTCTRVNQDGLRHVFVAVELPCKANDEFLEKLFPEQLPVVALKRIDQNMLDLGHLGLAEWRGRGRLLRIASEMSVHIHVLMNPCVDVEFLHLDAAPLVLLVERLPTAAQEAQLLDRTV
jgi:hypothetical protein